MLACAECWWAISSPFPVGHQKGTEIGKVSRGRNLHLSPMMLRDRENPFVSIFEESKKLS